MAPCSKWCMIGSTDRCGISSVITETSPSIAAEMFRSSVGSLDGTSCTLRRVGARAGHRQGDLRRGRSRSTRATRPGSRRRAARRRPRRRSARSEPTPRRRRRCCRPPSRRCTSVCASGMSMISASSVPRLSIRSTDTNEWRGDLLRHDDAVGKLVGADHAELELRAQLGRQAARGRLAEAVVGVLEPADLLAVELDGRRKSTSRTRWRRADGLCRCVIPDSIGRSDRQVKGRNRAFPADRRRRLARRGHPVPPRGLLGQAGERQQAAGRPSRRRRRRRGSAGGSRRSPRAWPRPRRPPGRCPAW